MHKILQKMLQHSFLRMGFIAGAGWVLDTVVYLGIATITSHVFIANIIGNCCGIAFSFIFGARHAFACRGNFLFRKFVLYAAFAFTMMPIFSGMLSWMVNAELFGLLSAKIIVTIPSFIANYFFMKWLIHSATVRKVDHV